MSNNINNDLVTPIIVTYNSSKYISKLLQSLEQSRKIIKEIIIFENSSPESFQTTKIIERYKVKSKIIINIIRNKKNIGFGKACNICVRKASSKYILFINPDSVIDPNAIKILISDLNKSNAIAIGGKCIRSDGGIHRTAVRLPNLISGIFEFTNIGKLFGIKIGEKNFYYDDKIYTNNKDVYVKAISGAFMLVNRLIYLELKGFDSEYFMYLEDVDFGYRAEKKGYKILFCPHAIAIHIGGGSSYNKDRILHTAWFKSRKTYFYKNCGVFENFILQPLFFIEEIIIYIKLKYVH